MSLLLLSGEPLFHGKPIIHVVPYGKASDAAETHEHAASFPALHGPDHVNGALVQRNTLVDGTTINNLRVGADPDVSNAELADGMPPGLVVEKEHITEFLHLADNSYLYYSPATLVGEDLVQDAHSYVQVGRSPGAALDEEKYNGVRLAHKLDDAGPAAEMEWMYRIAKQEQGDPWRYRAGQLNVAGLPAAKPNQNQTKPNLL